MGGGYVYMGSAACYAATGTDVVIVETDRHQFEALNDGPMPIHEPSVDDLVATHQVAGRL
ncbi:hypothetical protein AruPA_08410 [Acidiphilium sp. PA]|nr:hypothetical protein [Acidiphilium sp. PA]